MVTVVSALLVQLEAHDMCIFVNAHRCRAAHS